MKRVILNVGCGATLVQEAINMDNSKSIVFAHLFPMRIILILNKIRLISDMQVEFIEFVKKNRIKYASAEKIPVKDNTVDVLYTSHMFEHLTPGQREDFIREAKRVLKPDGILRFALPDLKYYVEEYLQTGESSELVDGLLMSVDKQSRMSIFLYGFRYHHYMWDAKSFSNYMSDNGFVCTILDAGNTLIPYETNIDLCQNVRNSFYCECRMIEK